MFFSVASLQHVLVRSVGVSVEAQILLCGPPYICLASSRALSTYDLSKKSVFLYNAQALSRGAVEPPAVVLNARTHEGTLDHNSILLIYSI